MNIPPAQTRTRRAHETAAFARANGRFAPVDRALFRAFFEQGLDINDPDVCQGSFKKQG
jgi:predicted DsbA family dithiol-disulfide isomerase